MAGGQCFDIQKPQDQIGLSVLAKPQTQPCIVLAKAVNREDVQAAVSIITKALREGLLIQRHHLIPSFNKQDIEDQRGEDTCPKLHSKLVRKPRLKSRFSPTSTFVHGVLLLTHALIS